MWNPKVMLRVAPVFNLALVLLDKLECSVIVGLSANEKCKLNEFHFSVLHAIFVSFLAGIPQFHTRKLQMTNILRIKTHTYMYLYVLYKIIYIYYLEAQQTYLMNTISNNQY